MKKITGGFLAAAIAFSIFTFSACREEKGTPSFSYKGILFEGFDPLKHFPSPEFARGVEKKKILFSREERKCLMKGVDLLAEKGLLFLLRIPRKFVVVDCPYSFADKPQMTVYIDKEKIDLNYSVADDWKNKLLKLTPHLVASGEVIHFQGAPELPNLLRIIIHEVGHLIEYKVLEFSWKGEFVANELNRAFVSISWDEENNWRDREDLLLRLGAIRTIEELVAFLSWFAGHSSYFSLYSTTGMNEDFAESFVFYYLKKHYGYSLQFTWGNKLSLVDLTFLTRGREEKLDLIKGAMEGEPGEAPLWEEKLHSRKETERRMLQ